jgi:hypothetical protein
LAVLPATVWPESTVDIVGLLIVIVAPTTRFVPTTVIEALGDTAYVSVFGDTLLTVGWGAWTVNPPVKVADSVGEFATWTLYTPGARPVLGQ